MYDAIKELSSGKSANSESPNSGHFLMHLTPKQQEKVVGLVEKGCEVKCQLNGKAVRVLWDTGSQVSVLLEEFLAHSFPEAQVRDISELVKGDLSLSATNGSEIPYKRWTEVRFHATPQSQDLIVPFLVSPEIADYPLLGCNVIEEAVKLDPDVACPELLHKSFLTIADDQLESLVNFIKSKHSDTELCSVKSGKNDAVVPKGTSAAISCRVNHGPIDKRTPVLFEPDQLASWSSGLIVQETLLSLKPGKSSRIKTEAINTTNHDIVLPNRTPLG